MDDSYSIILALRHDILKRELAVLLTRVPQELVLRREGGVEHVERM